MKSKNLIITIVLLLVTGGGSFYVGTLYQKSKTQIPQMSEFRSGIRPSGFPERLGVSGFRPVSGEIISVDGKTMTVRQVDGSSKIVIVSESTKISKSLEGTSEDLKIGEDVMVVGTQGDEGTVSAQNIQIGAMFRANDAP